MCYYATTLPVAHLAWTAGGTRAPGPTCSFVLHS